MYTFLLERSNSKTDYLFHSKGYEAGTGYLREAVQLRCKG